MDHTKRAKAFKVLDAVRRVKRGGYGSGTGCDPPPRPPPPAHPWCGGTTEGLPYKRGFVEAVGRRRAKCMSLYLYWKNGTSPSIEGHTIMHMGGQWNS